MRTETLKYGKVTHPYSDQMVLLAMEELRTHFVNSGEQRPGDLEDALAGGMKDLGLGAWRSTPYFPALARMVDAGTVSYREDENGVIWYRLTASL